MRRQVDFRNCIFVADSMGLNSITLTLYWLSKLRFSENAKRCVIQSRRIQVQSQAHMRPPQLNTSYFVPFLRKRRAPCRHTCEPFTRRAQEWQIHRLIDYDALKLRQRCYFYCFKACKVIVLIQLAQLPWRSFSGWTKKPNSLIVWWEKRCPQA